MNYNIKAKVATETVSVVRAAFSGAWRSVMDALESDSDSKWDGDDKIRQIMFDIERDLLSVEVFLRNKIGPR